MTGIGPSNPGYAGWLREAPGRPTANAPPPRTGAASAAETPANRPAEGEGVVDRVAIKPLDASTALQILLAEVRAELELGIALDAAAMDEGAAGDAAAIEPVVGYAAAADAAAIEALVGYAAAADAAAGGATAIESVVGDAAAGKAAAIEGVAARDGTRGGAPIHSAFGAATPADAASPMSAASRLARMFLQSLPAADAPDDAAARAPPGGVPGSDSGLLAREAAFRAALDRAVDTVSGWHDVSPTVVGTAQQARGLVAALLSDDPLAAVWLQPPWNALTPQALRYRRRRSRLRGRLLDPDLRRSSEAATDAAAEDSAPAQPSRDEQVRGEHVSATQAPAEQVRDEQVSAKQARGEQVSAKQVRDEQVPALQAPARQARDVPFSGKRRHDV